MGKRGTNLLSDMQIRRWVAAGEAIAKSDGAGLTFTLSKAGTATWVLRYMMAGRPRELTIGNYPDISLAAARKLAAEHRVSVDKGVDPAAEKRAEKLKALAAWTVRELAKDYLDKNLVPGVKPVGTLYYRKSDFEKIILPYLAPSEIRAVTPADIVDMLLKSGRSWSAQKRILLSTRKLFDHGIGRQIIQVNPATGIKLTALIGLRPAVRKRVMLSKEELQALLTGIDEIGIENALALRILLATCVRGNELVKARWEHIDLERGTWFVPDESVKTRVGFLVPLTPTVIAWFRKLRNLAGGSDWVLPARTRQRGDSHVGRTTLWAALKRGFERGDIDTRRFTPHDTRSTAKGHMRNLGVSREISEIALNHVLKGMEAIYDVREEIPERREALELWAAFLAACEQGQPWNVVPLKRPAAA
jgi:integrase